MPYETDRAALHAYLSLEAHSAWVTLSEANGVSVTALLEAIGLELEAEIAKADADEIRQALVKKARRIDAERRRRDRRRR
jgi:hypothetical protein